MEMTITKDEKVKARQSTSVLITGANGFIGKKLTKLLGELDEYKVSIAVRKKCQIILASHINVYEDLDLSNDCDWTKALENIDCVIHLAGRAHILNEKSENPLEDFRKINTEGTLNLASQAAKCGVKRFIFLK